MQKNEPKCLGTLPNDNVCQECSKIELCKEIFEKRLKKCCPVEKRGHRTRIDWDIAHVGLELTDEGKKAVDALYIKFANEKSFFHRGTSCGVFKIPTETYATFYVELLKIFTNSAMVKEWHLA